METMAALNGRAAEIMVGYPVNGCTDVTGFGLLGHALEIASGSKVTIILFTENVPQLPEVLDSVQMGLVPAGSYSNRNFCTHQIRQSVTVDPMLLNILANAQTSGELLISLPEDKASALFDDLKAGGAPHAALIGLASTPGAGLPEIRQASKGLNDKRMSRQ
ncbi:MAG: hypothetical protein KBH99_09690 [Syntrophobacteraceae bacterium]|nr:hypothetical protein [Syntrophobacteraceae bacterium]